MLVGFFVFSQCGVQTPERDETNSPPSRDQKFFLFASPSESPYPPPFEGFAWKAPFVATSPKSVFPSCDARCSEPLQYAKRALAPHAGHPSQPYAPRISDRKRSTVPPGATGKPKPRFRCASRPLTWPLHSALAYPTLAPLNSSSNGTPTLRDRVPLPPENNRIKKTTS
jgi:hypothetical protein